MSFIDSLKDVLINMILLVSTKLTSPSQNKFHKNVIVSAHDVTNKVLLRESNYIADEVIWSNFGDSIISMREVTIISILYGFDQKNQFH